MLKIEIVQQHKDTAEVAKVKLDTLSKELSEKYGLSSKWLSDTEAKVERTGMSGHIKIEPTHVKVSLDMSFVFSGIRAKVEETIKEGLKEQFG